MALKYSVDMYYMTDCYMGQKPDFEKSVINFKWQEYCHCPIRPISANNSKCSNKSVNHGGKILFSAL